MYGGGSSLYDSPDTSGAPSAQTMSYVSSGGGDSRSSALKDIWQSRSTRVLFILQMVVLIVALAGLAISVLELVTPNTDFSTTNVTSNTFTTNQFIADSVSTHTLSGKSPILVQDALQYVGNTGDVFKFGETEITGPLRLLAETASVGERLGIGNRYELTFPTALPKASGNVLLSDLDGKLSWGKLSGTDGQILVANSEELLSISLASSVSSAIANAIQSVRGTVGQLNVSLTDPKNPVLSLDTSIYSAISGYADLMPTTAPRNGEIMQFNDTAGRLVWTTQADGPLYPSTRNLFVDKGGSDSLGNGTADAPFATLLHALNLALTMTSANTPTCIHLGAGIFVEDNANYPIVAVQGLSIEGQSQLTTVLRPSSPTLPFLQVNGVTFLMSNLKMECATQGVSTSSAVHLIGNVMAIVNECVFKYMKTAVVFDGTAAASSFAQINNSWFNTNENVAYVTNAQLNVNNCLVFGNLAGAVSSQFNGITVHGSDSITYVNGCVMAKLGKAVIAESNAFASVNATNFINNHYGLYVSSTASVNCDSSVFRRFGTLNDVAIFVTDSGSNCVVLGVYIDGRDLSGTINGNGVQCQSQGMCQIQSAWIQYCRTAITCGQGNDSSTTSLSLNNSFLDSTNQFSVVQFGTSSLALIGTSVARSKLNISDYTNVQLNIQDMDNGNINVTGNMQNVTQSIMGIGNKEVDNIVLGYNPAMYNSEAVTITNPDQTNSGFSTSGPLNSALMAQSTTTSGQVSLKLLTDTSETIGDGTSVRGWSLIKDAATSKLLFSFQNNIPGVTTMSPTSVLQLDPITPKIDVLGSTPLVWSSDTNLYRRSAGVLKTDGSLALGNVTASSALIADGSGVISSSGVSAAELGYVQGVTAPIQAQINSTFQATGGTLTGPLVLPNGTAATPSLKFQASGNTGLASGSTNTLNLITSGETRLSIDPNGVTSITGDLVLTPLTTAGVLHNSSSGGVTSALITNGDIAATTISNAKLATVSASNNPNYLVVRDANGKFVTSGITLLNAPQSGGDAVNKSYVDESVALGLSAKPAARLYSDVNQALSGLPVLDGIQVADGDRILLNGQTSAVENGVWVASSGSWTRAAESPTGGTIGQAYVLVEEGNAFMGTSWLCNSATAVIDTDPITFVQFSLPTVTSGTNVGTGEGQVYQGFSGNQLSFRTIEAGAFTQVSNNADSIAISVTATNANTPSTIVSRNSSGNFAAGTITASLTGLASLNLPLTGGTLTGSLTLPAGGPTLPSLLFTGSQNTGISTSAVDVLNFIVTGTSQMKIGSTGVVVPSFSSAGVVHNSGSGLLSSALIVDADIASSAGIANSKLATLTTSGLVANSATTAASANTPGAIVARDGSGSFSANVITANSLIGSVTGHASLDVQKSGDVMTGTLTLPSGTVGAPSLQFSTGTNTGLSATVGGDLIAGTAGLEALRLTTSQNVVMVSLASTGLVHASSTGQLSSSLLVDNDIAGNAAISNSKLAQLTSPGLVANSATTATANSANNAIVARDASGNFSANTITASLTGLASLNLPLSGGTLTGTLTVPAGSNTVPSFKFTGGTNTGIAMPVADQLAFLTGGSKQLTLTSVGVTVPSLNVAGLVHNAGTGQLSTSLLVDADIDAAANIGNDKLATLTQAGLVSNSATTATDINSANAIVARDSTGNFSAGVITASLVGSVTGHASLDVQKSGDTMTGALTLPAGSATVPSLKFTGGTNTGVSMGSTNTLNLLANGATVVTVGTSGLTIPSMSSAGILHNSSAGLVTSSLIVDADIAGSAAIANSKLATLTSSGLVANSATTANSLNTANSIVARDSAGNFSASTITADLIGDVTGAASLNLLKSGDAMSGALTLAAGTATTPSVTFAGSSTSGLSMSTANTLNVLISGTSMMTVNTNGVSVPAFVSSGVVHNNSSGLLSTSLIVNADISSSANIANSKLATLTTAGLVANSATTAASVNSANAIVTRDASGNFSAGTITASFIGTLTGAASLNVLKTGDTLTGPLILAAGDATTPSLAFTGGVTTGFAMGAANTVQVISNGVNKLSVSPSGVTVPSFSSAGLVHNSSSGLLTSSLLVDADIASNAAIGNNKLSTLTAVGLVANSATTATDANTAGAIVARDASGNFAAGTITAALTGHASLDLALAGGTLTGSLTLPSGTSSAPSLLFSGGSNTGLAMGSANVVNVVVSGNPVMNVAASGVSIVPFSTAGLVHNNASGLLTSSLIVDADISSSAAISNSKLATLSASGLVANSATTATSANTASAIVSRDSSGNFSAGTIIASLTGLASLNLPLAGGSMSGVITAIAGTSTSPAIAFNGGTNTGLAMGATNTVNVIANGITQLTVAPTGLTVPSFITAGVMHNSSSGAVTSSLIVDADISGSAAIANAKLATLTASGLVANSATTATSANTVNAIVTRDGSGNFAAGTITASLTGHASLDLLLSGGTMTGALTLPSGTASSPSLLFSGGTNTGLSMPTSNQLTLSASGSAVVNVAAAGLSLPAFSSSGILHNNASGLVSSSLIVDADISGSAAIGNSKLATLTASGLVANSATTATNANSANAIVSRDVSGNFSAGTITASLTGLASLNLPLTGGTLSGNLTVPAGTTTAPSLLFSGGTNTGFSMGGTNVVDVIVSGVTRAAFSATGLTLPTFSTAGVLHNNSSGDVSSSLIVGGDISAATILNSHLASVSAANTINNLVVRDGSGNFAANMITLAGTTTNATDVATKAYVDNTAALGLSAHPPALVVSLSNQTLSGLSTIDGLVLVAGNRVLLTAQTDPVQNGIWLAASGSWTRPTDFSAGVAAGQAYVLITEGNNYVGTSWLCNTPTAIIGTDAISFAQFALPTVTTGTNLGAGAGQVFASYDGDNMNFRTLANGTYSTIASTAEVITIDVNATSGNTASTVVARDGTGNFSAGTITANLVGSVTGSASGNLLLSGGSLTGALTLPAGSSTSPTLLFTGSTNSGLSLGATNQLNLIANGATIATVSPTGLSVPAFAAAGVVHNSSAGLFTSSLIVDADISGSAAISNSKLATLTSTGLVSNSATTANSANTANAIVARDASGNFSAGTITASLTGLASLNLPLTGGTLSGTVTIPAGSGVSPSLRFTGGTNTGFAMGSTNVLNAVANGVTGLTISSTAVALPLFSTAGVVHNNASGVLTSSLIVDADISGSAAIANGKLATLTASGLVANSATTATSANTVGAIVSRDGSGNFSAGTITASLTGHASLDLALTGGTLTGNLTVPAGTSNTPSLAFDGGLGTGFCMPTADVISVLASGNTVVNISGGGMSLAQMGVPGIIHNSNTGFLTSSLIVNADISNSAAIANSKLATLTSAGLVANSATTATSNNSGNAIVARDSLGNFSAGTITASLTGHASLDLALTGGTLTGNLAVPTGSSTVPSLAFGSSTTGLSMPSLNVVGILCNGVNQLSVSGSGLTVPSLSTLGVLHNDANGVVSTSLIVDADISSSAAIANTKLATLTTSGLVANSATTATSLNTGSAIVARDSSGNFSAGTISANLTGNVTGALTGSASGNLLLTGGTLSGNLTLPTGSATSPSLLFSGSTNTGIATGAANVLNLISSGTTIMTVSSAVGVTVPSFSTSGIVHNSSTGVLSTSLIVNADISSSAAIGNNKLATLTTAGLVSNSATTATNLNTASAIVARDASGNFSAGTITASLIGSVTGAASANLLLTGGSLSGTLTIPAGTAVAPSLLFTGGTSTGLAMPSTNVVSVVSNGTAILNVSGSGVTVPAFTASGVVKNSSAGLLSSGLIADADIGSGANIANAKLATLTTAGLVANSATTATSANTASAIVSRDGSGNFSAGTITASLVGTVTGSASANLLLTGGILTGALTVPAGNSTTPTLNFTGGLTTGLALGGANVMNLIANGVTVATISSTNGFAMPAFTSAGIVHNNASGAFSSSLITDSDISSSAAIANTKLATLTASGLVANSATTATNLNTAGAIVSRDGSGNFSAGTITASVIGNVTGLASLNLPLAGGTLTGNLTVPNGSPTAPSLLFSGGTSTGISMSPADTLNMISMGTTVLSVGSTGASLPAMTTAGVVHNSSAGLLTSSLIVNADISSSAAIANSKLATLTTAGLVANSATTATSGNTVNAIVARDASGNFAAGTITASLTGHASLDLALTGGTLSGNLTIPAGSATVPSLQFSGGSNTGISMGSTNVLNMVANGTTMITIGSSGVAVPAFTSAGVIHNNSSGVLSTSLVGTADIATGAITNGLLASASSTNTASSVVLRDGTGNFSTNMISIAGSPANATDAATVSYVNSAALLTPKTAATAFGSSNQAITGTYTLDGVALAVGNRVLLAGQTTQSQNGLWVVATGAWTRPSDYPTGSKAGQAFIPITSGTTYAGTSWLCSTPNIVVDTGATAFTQFSSGVNITGANLGSGTGLYATSNGTQLSFKSLSAGTYSTLASNSTSVTVDVNATSANTASTVVARDAGGNFSAGTITASLTGHASLDLPLTGGTLTGNLTLPSMAFSGSANTGFITLAPNVVSAFANSVQTMDFAATGVESLVNMTVPAGTSSTPSLAFANSATTGLSASTANVLNLVANGVTQMTVSAAGVSATTSVITPTLQATSTTNQVILGSGNTLTVNSLAQSADRVFTIPVVNGTAEFQMISTSGGKEIVMSFESVATSGTTLTAALMSNGIARISGNITLDTGANIAANAALAPFNVAGAVFKVLVVNTSALNRVISSGTNCTMQAGATTLIAASSRLLYFVASGAGVWNVY